MIKKTSTHGRSFFFIYVCADWTAASGYSTRQGEIFFYNRQCTIAVINKSLSTSCADSASGNHSSENSG